MYTGLEYVYSVKKKPNDKDFDKTDKKWDNKNTKIKVQWVSDADDCGKPQKKCDLGAVQLFPVKTDEFTELKALADADNVLDYVCDIL